jgi:hypothetical protein
MSAILVSTNEQNPVRIAAAINQLARGGSNSVGSVTLTPSATSTTVQAPTCSTSCYVFLSPTTPNAANDMATTSTVAGTGQFVITHANNTRVDRTFGWVIFG